MLRRFVLLQTRRAVNSVGTHLPKPEWPPILRAIEFVIQGKFGDMIEHAVQLARALDAEDYDAAMKHLAPDCTYEFRGRILNGAKAVIASYRAAGEAARARFDTIRYERSVAPVGTDGARIDYTDIVTLAGDTHAHRCAQEVSLGKDGLVLHIRHIDLEGERETLQDFEARHAEQTRCSEPGDGALVDNRGSVAPGR